jgi:molybdenum cofactor synthesis domain-containing protein
MPITSAPPLSVREAQTKILDRIRPLDSERVPLGDAAGRVAAGSVTSGLDLPPWDNSAMDGYAVRAADVAPGSELPVALDLPAGSASGQRLPEAAAARIMTGAPLPEGADAIIKVELTRPAGFDVLILDEVPVGNHVRPAGDDIGAGTEVFHPGAVLTPGHLGVLASIGREKVKVYRRPRVAVMSTGDELVEGPQPLQPGQIRDSNRLTLLSLVAEAGFHPIDLGLVRDDERAIKDALQRGVAQADAVITSGGVSMGDFDFVKSVLTELGDFNWMQVAIKPAKPLAFGVMSDSPVFGLPGNPVSSMVSFELFARPALRRMMGRLDAERPHLLAIADEPLLREADGKVHFQRVIVSQQGDGAWHARSAGGQGSHQLMAMATANGLAVLPDGPGVESGGSVRVMYLG